MSSVTDVLLLVWDFLGKNATNVIAICALAFTAYQAFLQRKHNRLTVKPHIALYTTGAIEPQDGKIRISLVNHGLGPAQVKDYQVFFDGALIDVTNPLERIKVGNQAFGGDLADFDLKSLASDYWIKAGESHDVLVVRYRTDIVMEIFENVAGTRLKRFRVSLKYKSLYDSKWITFDSESA